MQAGPLRACNCPPHPQPSSCPLLRVLFPTAAPRRAGRRDAGVRADFGKREFLEPQEGRPPAMYPILCPGGWVPSLTHRPPFAADSGRLCARGLVSAVCGVRLLILGSRSPLLWTSYPAFVEGGGAESRERPQTRQMEPGVKWRGCKGSPSA